MIQRFPFKQTLSTKKTISVLEAKEGWKRVVAHGERAIPTESTGPLLIFPIRLPRPPWQSKDPEVLEMEDHLWKEFLSLQKNPIMQDHWKRKTIYKDLPYFSSGFFRLAKIFPGFSWALGAFIIYSGVSYFLPSDKDSKEH